MHPHIDKTTYGSITIDDACYHQDVIIRSDGQIRLRKRGLSMHSNGGNSLVISGDEARDLCAWGATRLVIGTGQHGTMILSKEAQAFLREVHCIVDILTTPDAIDAWNRAEEGAAGLFHVTG